MLNLRPEYSVHLLYSAAVIDYANTSASYIHYATSAPRGFSTDLFIVGFLDKYYGPENYDVLTDHEIHWSPDVLTQYDVVLSGSHPEYISSIEMRALQKYTESGGLFIYAGGNGFYWKVDVVPNRPHAVEVRRGAAGCRTYSLPPGERFHTDGSAGGLWRDLGLPANDLCGIGSAACGFGPGVPLMIDPVTRYDRGAQFLFEGVSPFTHILGGLSLFGRPASGDEIDRHDEHLGPKRTMKLASSSYLGGRHPRCYTAFPEDVKFPMLAVTGPECPTVRTDMVWTPGRLRGGVLAMGSMDIVSTQKQQTNTETVLTRI